MNEKKTNKKSSDKVKKDKEYEIPYEAACSPEFGRGCFIMEEEAEEKFKDGNRTK
jgi:hypothetical protein